MHIIKRHLHQCWQPLTRLLIQQWKGLLMCTVPPLSSPSCFLSSGASSHNIFPFLLFSRQPGIEVLRNTSSTLLPTTHSAFSSQSSLLFWLQLLDGPRCDNWYQESKKPRGQLVPTVLTDRWVDRSALYKSWLRRRGGCEGTVWRGTLNAGKKWCDQRERRWVILSGCSVVCYGAIGPIIGGRGNQVAPTDQKYTSEQRWEIFIHI